MSENQSDWDDHLTYVLSAYRASIPISPQIMCFSVERIEPSMDLVYGSPVDEIVGTVSMNLSVGFKRKWQHHMP